jgi:hypothetical protein
MVHFHAKLPNLGMHILEGLGMENVGIFYCYIFRIFTDIWHILWSIGTFCGQLVHFVVNWYIFERFVKLH